MNVKELELYPESSRDSLNKGSDIPGLFYFGGIT